MKEKGESKISISLSKRVQRRGFITLLLSLISINFVSAQFYDSLSISDALRAVDPSTMVLGIIFVIAALLINAGLSRAGPFRYNRTGSGIISISLALLIIWGIDRFGFDYYGFFNGIAFFIPEGLLETIWPLLFLLGIFFVGWKFGWKYILLALGIFLIWGAFFAYESGLLLILGGFFILLWIILLLKKKGPVGYSNYPYGQKAWGAAKGLGRGAVGTVKGGWRGANVAGRGLGKGTKWFGKKSKSIGREWTKRDQQMKEKMAQAQQTKQTQKEEQTRQEQQQRPQEKQQKIQQKQLGMDFKALKKQITETQRNDPKNPNLEGWIKQLKAMRKQM